MKWKFTMAMAAMPWVVFALLSWGPTGQSRDSLLWTVAFLFGMVLWPIFAFLISIFWSATSDAEMAKARSYVAIQRARYGLSKCARN